MLRLSFYCVFGSIRYEDLVRNPETYLSDVLVKKLGVAFEDNVLEYYNMPRSVQTHSQSRKFQLCIYKSFWVMIVHFYL